MASTRKLTVEIAGDVKGVRSAFGQADRAADGFSRKMSRVATAIGGAFAVREVVEFGGALIDAAEESQKVTRQTAAVIKSMGNAAGVSADQVADLSTELSLKAGIDDELIQSGANVLLTFKNLRNEVGKGNDIFDQATGITLDLSVALKKDMNSAAILVGKALNDPIKGLTSLTRAGVQFTDQQKDQIKAMVEAGDVAGAQKMILAELESQFAGSAEAQATASGKLAVAWDNAKERLGTALQPAVEKVSLWLAENLPGAIDKTMAALSSLKDWVDRNETAVKALAVAAGVVLVAAFAAWAAGAAFAAAATIAATWPVLAIGAAVGALAYGLWYAYKNFGWFKTGVDGIVGSVQKAIGWVQDLAEAIDRVTGAFYSLQALTGSNRTGQAAYEFAQEQQRAAKAVTRPLKGARAMGGPVTPGDWVIGEDGPEILSIGSSGYVTPNSRIEEAAPSQGDVYNINITGESSESTAMRVVRELRREHLMVAG